MTWFKVDDTLAFHHKTTKAGNAAMGLWLRCGSWSAQQLTDGWVPAEIAAMIGTPPQIARLVTAGFWHEAERDGQPGYQFHEWAGDETQERQPTRAAVERRRADARRRKAKQREREAAERTADPSSDDHDTPDDDTPSGENADRTRTERGPNADRFGPENRSNQDVFGDSPQVNGHGHANVTRVPANVPDPTRPYREPTPPVVTSVGTSPPRARENDDAPATVVAEVVPAGPAPSGPNAANAQRIVAALGGRHPARVRNALAQQTAAALDQGIPMADVQAGLAKWRSSGLHTSQLHELISQVVRERDAPRRSAVAEKTFGYGDLGAEMVAAARAAGLTEAALAVGGATVHQLPAGGAR